MKKFLLLLGMIFCAFNLSAQNYDSYLQSAYTALVEGKIEVAQSSYNIYKKMTGKTDLDFETLIKDADVNAWKSSCHIIIVNDTLSLAVQKIAPNQTAVTYQVATIKAKASRLGNFTDWRLPKTSELEIILPNITIEDSDLRGDICFWVSNIGQQISIISEITFRNGLQKSLKTSIFSCYAMNSHSYNVMETYYECKEDNSITESRGNKDFCCNYIIVRTFNPQE